MQPVPSVTRLGQATAVEQARAVAEVAAAVQVAQACPRDLERARMEMRRSCTELAFAERAFYSFPRGGKAVTGPTIAFARELKRAFGNFQSGVSELRRDDVYGQSEMQAWAWDVQTNSRSVATFVVPHASYMTGKTLEDLRDIYENNANQGARREREMILGLIPTWFVEEAVRLCRETIERGDGTPMAQRQERAAAALAGIGVSLDRVERRVGRERSLWSPQDLAQLTVWYHTIKRGEMSADELFPAPRLTVDDVSSTAAAPADATPSAAATPTAEMLSESGWERVNTRLNQIGVTGPGQQRARLAVLREMLDMPDLTRGKQMTAQQGESVLDQLAGRSGVEAVVRILTEAKAPEHLIPVLDDQPEDDAQDVEDQAPEQAGAGVDVPDDATRSEPDDPYDTFDPTVQAGFGPGDDDQGGADRG